MLRRFQVVRPAGLAPGFRPAGPAAVRPEGLRSEDQMPGPWVFLKDNVAFYETLEFKKGAYLDAHLYDSSHQSQGYGLWRIRAAEKKKKEGVWLEATLVAASDDHLNWWLREGPGSGHGRKFLLHLCAEAEVDCAKTKRKKDLEFHTDYFRLLDVGDIHEKCLTWAKTGMPNEDLVAEQARLSGAAPRGRNPGGKASGSKPPHGGLSWSVTDDEEEGSDQQQAVDVKKKLSELKKQVEKCEKEATSKKTSSKKKKKKTSKEKGSKKKKKGGKAGKKAKQSRSPQRPDVTWFGRARKAPRQSSNSSSSSEEATSGSKESSSTEKRGSGSKSKKSKKRKRGDEADRGPYGVGAKLRYDGKEDSSGSDGSEDGEKTPFRAGLSSKSHHLQLQEYAERRPGRLASRLLQKMDKILSRQESPMHQYDGKNLTPSTGTSYFLTVIVPQYRDKLSMRTSRELRSTAKALDLIAQGKQDRAADVLAQRYKALEMSLADQGWQRAQHLELIPAEGAVLTEHDELVMVTKEQKDDLKLRAMATGATWKGQGKYEPEKGKTKGKGKGKKGNPLAEAKRSRTPLVRRKPGKGKGKRSPPVGVPWDAKESNKSELPLEGSRKAAVPKTPPKAKPAEAAIHGSPKEGKRNKAGAPAEAGRATALKKEEKLVEIDPEVAGDLSEDAEGCPTNLFRLDFDTAKDLAEWTSHVLLRAVAQPSTSTSEVGPDKHGDVLPIHPEGITTDISGVTESNIDWVKLVIVCVDFHYCVGWSKPICVPFKLELSENQRAAVSHLAETIGDNIICADGLPTLGECDKLLASKKFDYAGRPVEYMEDLVCERVLPAWPKAGQAGIQPIEDFLSSETRALRTRPEGLLLAPEMMPRNALRSRVRATDKEWFHLVKEAAARGMMKPVEDSKVPKDRSGHLVTNGAGGVLKEKVVNGKVTQCQRFISIMCPINAVTTPISGSQGTLPYIGQLTGLLLEESESLYLESEDLQSAFNLFSIPEKWYGFFAYSKKVDQSAFGLPAGKMVRPCLSVIPMGWHSAVALVQEAVRDLVFNRAGVPRHLSAEKGKPLPQTKTLAVVYLDNFDEIQIIRSLDVDLNDEGREMSENHANFNRVCDEAGLPRNLGKQLIHAFSGGMQGGHFDGIKGVLKVGPDKLKNYLGLSLCLLSKKQWSEFNLRHWTGKTAFLATFKRSLFSGMGRIFDAIQLSRNGPVQPSAAVVDEIFVVMAQSVLSQTNLRARLSLEVSCTDASPTGGGSGTATSLKQHPLLSPPPCEFDGTCGVCAEEMEESTLGTRYKCPGGCGRICCSVFCFSKHRKLCPRIEVPRRVFGERFSGPEFPLTKAVALLGMHVQPPLDLLHPVDPWDFFSEDGKARLDEYSDEGDLEAEHWAPECKTVSAARARPIWTQGNAMAKRSIQGVREGDARGKFESLEHPWNSWLWSTEEAMALCDIPGFFVTGFSHCCFGGRRTKWTCIVHNIPAVHEAMDKQTCDGHPDLLPYEVHELDDGSLSFDTAKEAMYPWAMCKVYARALGVQVQRQHPSPQGDMPFDSETAIMSVLRSSTRGLQNEERALAAAKSVVEVMRTMAPGQEKSHLMDMLRHVSLRGTDVKLQSEAEDGSESILAPYPAFLWEWTTKLAYPWKQAQHINELEVAAFLVEYRRRTRHKGSIGTRFFNITDSGPSLDHIEVELCRRAQSAFWFAMSRSSHLKYAGISARTLALYEHEVSQFLFHLEMEGRRPPRSYRRLDLAVANYINHLYQEGETLTKAGWLLSGMRRLYPRMRRELAIAQQWYNNWARQHAPARAVPLTWQLTQGFVALAIQQKWYNLALLFLIGFTFFLRTQELLALEPADFLIDPEDGSLILRIASSKTSRGAQPSLALHDQKLALLVRWLLTKVPLDCRLWQFSTSHFRNVFRAFCSFFDVGTWGFVPYSLRRGGATAFYMRTNSLDTVMIQGRWRDATTARIYLDDARATLVRMRLSPATRELLVQYRTQLAALMHRFARGKL
eukprot:Skav211119  [mRNA]  locus=scaffold2659:123518:130322:- [translate_table: standard]